MIRGIYTNLKAKQKIEEFNEFFKLPVDDYNTYLLREEYLIGLKKMLNENHKRFIVFIRMLTLKQIENHYRQLDKIHNLFNKRCIMVYRELQKKDVKN